jgi:acetyl-CoA acyltransferase
MTPPAAICTGIANIQTGVHDVVIAGGVETFSDVPIRFSRPIRERMIAMGKVRPGRGIWGLRIWDL